MLAGYARHPNFSHVIVLGLGCEVNQIGGMMKEHQLTDRIRNMDIQSMGGTRKTVEAGMAFVREVLAESNNIQRQTVPAGELKGRPAAAVRTAIPVFRQSGSRGRQRPCRTQWRHGDLVGNDRDLWCRAHLHASCGQPRGRGEKLVALMHWWEEYTHKHEPRSMPIRRRATKRRD